MANPDEHVAHAGRRSAVAALADTAWRHALRIVRPASARHPDVAILIVGSDMHREFVDETALADAAGAVVARLDDVPNQPLYGRYAKTR